jgi:hypothetical protein
MNMKYNIQLPFFPGFYESDLENGDTAYWAIKEELDYYHNDYCGEWGQEPKELRPIYEQLTEDDLDFDYKAYEEEVRTGWVESFRSRMPEFILSLENVEMTSPQYYNFETDRLWVDVELAYDWMDTVREFMAKNSDWLRDRIKEDWTSYDGFMSFMSNNFDDLRYDNGGDNWSRDKSWYWHLFSGQSDRFECYLSTIIGYMMARKNKDIRNDLVMDALEDVYAGQYVFITPEGEEKLQELRDQREEDIREGRIVLPDPAQMELPFND